MRAFKKNNQAEFVPSPNEDKANPYSHYLKKDRTRNRRSVCIRQEIHEEIAELVRFFGGNGATIGGYIDRVLQEHLTTHRDEIANRYKALYQSKIR